MSQAPNYGLDWFEGAISRPDLVLLDFAAAVRPSEYPVPTPLLSSASAAAWSAAAWGLESGPCLLGYCTAAYPADDLQHCFSGLLCGHMRGHCWRKAHSCLFVSGL